MSAYKGGLMSQWYLSYDGNQTGPFSQAEAAEQGRKKPGGFAWRDGFTDWMPIGQIAELNKAVAAVPVPPAPTAATTRGVADEIDFKVFGAENAVCGSRA